MKELIKQQLEQLTGIGKPSMQKVRAARQDVKPQPFHFNDDGAVPNNPLPLLIYKGVVRFVPPVDEAAIFEALFAANGWGGSWRNGIYPYVHYHSQIHEVLGVARGQARVRFGGDAGEELDIEAGDAAVLPAGAGHHCLMASPDFLVVGAYPPDGRYDECRGRSEQHARALKTIPQVPVPQSDPLFGADGPLRKLWMG